MGSPGSSALQTTLRWQLQGTGLWSDDWLEEFRFAPPRRWRVDFCHPPSRLVVEVEGGLWLGRGADGQRGGRHTRPAGYQRDIAKYNELTLRGWRLLRVTGDDVDTGRALAWIKAGLGLADGTEQRL